MDSGIRHPSGVARLLWTMPELDPATPKAQPTWLARKRLGGMPRCFLKTTLRYSACEKPARSPIGEGNRLTFLRELAFWLWTAKGSATSFHASDIPEVLLDGLPDGDCEEFEEKCREYLAGAFLERKAGDLFFFPHRSFAEFLVAQRMYFNPPGPADPPGWRAGRCRSRR